MLQMTCLSPCCRGQVEDHKHLVLECCRLYERELEIIDVFKNMDSLLDSSVSCRHKWTALPVERVPQQEFEFATATLCDGHLRFRYRVLDPIEYTGACLSPWG
jgi:hypothetical protein